MMRSRLSLFIFALFLLVPAIATASSMNFDIRFRGGMAAGADKMTIDPAITADGSGDSSQNFQLDVVFSPLQESKVGPVFNAGFFKRTHSGSVQSVFFGLPPTSVDYDVAGLNLGAGVRATVNRHFHTEGKVEVSLGVGKAELSSPGVVFNEVQEDDYASVSLMIGGYYTFSQPGLQLGVEVGYQSFTGNFQIWNSYYDVWNDAKIEGSGPIANVVAGFRF